jgi:hypothetical protein
MPYLGLPLFNAASLRPLRNWPDLVRSMKPTSEASVYHAFIKEAITKIQDSICNAHLNVLPG